MKWILICLIFGVAKVYAQQNLVYSLAAQAGSACSLLVTNVSRMMSRNATCFDPMIFVSVVGCLQLITDGSPRSILNAVNKICLRYDTEFGEDAITNALQLYDTFATDFTEVGHGPIMLPFRVNTTYRDLSYKSYKYFLGNYNNSIYYGSALLGFWLGVLMLYASVNWGRRLFPLRRQRRFVKAMQRYIFAPATFRHKNYDAVLLGRFEVGLVPKRVESLIIAAFVIITAVLTGIKIYWDPDNTIYPVTRYPSEAHAKTVFISRIVADRSGIIGVFLMPLLIVLGGRNNFLQWLTGLSFATMIVWHKWISRVCIIEILIHMVCFTIALDTRRASEYSELYLVGGTFAFIAMFIILFQTLLFLRRRWYEAFFLFHVVLSVLTVVGLWLHLAPLGYGPFMYAAVAVWGLDRCVRFVRMALIGVKSAEFTLIEDTIVIKAPISNPQYYPPGGHLFLTVPNGIHILQSHPFCYVVHSDHITLFSKVKEGLTSLIAKNLVKLPSMSCTMPVLFDGPYAEPASINRYDNALFLASGNGIPGMWSEALTYAQKHRDRKVKLVWISRTTDWFADELTMIPSNIELLVYHTGVQMVHESASESDKKLVDEKGSLKPIPKILTIQGRPDLQDLIKSEAVNARTNLAVVVCGHPVMVDEVRAIVARGNWDSPAFVDLFVQLQVWA